MFEGNCFEIVYQKKFPFVKISKNNLFIIFLISVIVGVSAFIFETLLDYIAMGYLYDRGFLIGPFIPVYFFCILIGLMFIKTPKISLKNFILYTFIIGFSISAVEFIVGNVCELLFHDVLWSYDGFMPLSYQYVSLTVALIWGVGGTILFMFVFPFLKTKLEKFPLKLRKPFVIIFWVLLISDFIATLTLILLNNGYYEDLYCIKRSTSLTLLMISILLYIIFSICFAKFLYQHFNKYKKQVLILHFILMLIPIFSLLDYKNHFTNIFLKMMSQIGFYILTIYLYLTLFLLLCLFVFYIVKKCFHKNNIKIKYGFYASIVFSLIIMVIGGINANICKVKKLKIGEGNKNMNIVMVSDIRLGEMNNNIDLEKLVYKINDLKPDLVLFLGDFIATDIKQLDKNYFTNTLKKIESTYGNYAVEGNSAYKFNDYYEVVDFYSGSGVELLTDDYVEIQNEILLIGRVDVSLDERIPLKYILPKDNILPIILMDHQPQNYNEAFNEKVLLQLSGHTLNGQLFPLNIVTKLFYCVYYQFNKTYGLYENNGQYLYVSSGYGTIGLKNKNIGHSEIVQIKLSY